MSAPELKTLKAPPDLCATIGMATTRIPPGVERRIRREARSATLRELALLRRREGWTLAAIGVALGVSVTRVHQIIRKAERLIREGSRPCDDPLDAGRCCVNENRPERDRWAGNFNRLCLKLAPTTQT